jgi:hypothetical protein
MTLKGDYTATGCIWGDETFHWHLNGMDLPG